jgi:putative membrane protein
MRHFILRVVVSGVGLLFVAHAFFPKGIVIEGITASILAVGLIGILNGLVRPLLFIVKLLAFPVNLLTLGLFGLLLSWIVNVLIFLIVGQLGLIDGFEVRGVGAAVMGSFALSVINCVATLLIGSNKEEKE